jgi:Dyp-type peroxidase family
VTTAEEWPKGWKPATTLNVALSATGLAALGVSGPVLESFSDEFRGGMRARADRLGDLGPSAPENWQETFRGGDAHLLVTVNAMTEAQLESELEGLRASIAEAGLPIVHEEHAQLFGEQREHFGYRDGFAQPVVEGQPPDFVERNVAGGGVPTKDGWRPLAPGEFILGYEDEDSRVDPERRLPSAPIGPLGRSGTYMVWRKLHQDVALFRRTLRDAAQRYDGGDEDLLKAKLVGRWPNGTPLVLSAKAPIEGFEAEAADANDFRYADADGEGLRCPLGAHIRRANPRDALGFEGLLSFRHRIIRRGMPYGPRLREGAMEDDGHDRGLVFVCFNASISRQFESVQLQWLNDGNSLHLGHDSDFLLGDPIGTGKMTVQGAPPFFLAPQGPLVRMRGGEYLFVPGLTGLAALADGTAG